MTRCYLYDRQKTAKSGQLRRVNSPTLTLEVVYRGSGDSYTPSTSSEFGAQVFDARLGHPGKVAKSGINHQEHRESSIENSA